MNVLDQILERKAHEVARQKALVPASELLARADRQPAARSLYGALSAPGGATRIISEVKRASPSAGTIDASVDAPVLAQRYEQAGAAAISVLTDGPGFGGSLDDLIAVRASVGCPMLRKEFVLDEYQVLEARAAGADAVLLIVAALERARLEALLAACRDIGVEALVEVHTADELDTALAVGSRIVGVNNRNLATFHVDLATSEALLPRLPNDVRGIAESGVRTVDDVRRLRKSGAANFLIGEALVRAPDAAELLRAMQEPV